MISIIIGTRPEIIKMCPVIRECERRRIPYSIVHTGQHYSYEMDRVFFEELDLPQANHYLDVGSGTHGNQTGRMMSGLESVISKDMPDMVMVEGDTNTVLAGALVASKLHILVGHVEAGLRSGDRTMPEEINRIVADHVSDHLYAPTVEAKENLSREGIVDGVFITGNTVVDSVHQNMEVSKRKSRVVGDIVQVPYLLATAHRQENVDVKSKLEGILEGLKAVSKKYDMPVIFPAHPRTKKMIREFNIDTEGIELIDPCGYLDFLQLEANAELVLTDSGGVQEETCILGVPCVTLRENTERPETISVGSNLLAGTNPDTILGAATSMMESPREWKNPYGDGKAANRIIDLSLGVMRG